jgi:hypothetical protein
MISLIHTYNKLKDEWVLLKYHFINILVDLFLTVYVAGGVARNIAYYRNVQGSRLKDLGYEIIPEINDKFNIISEIVMWIINIIGFSILVIPVFYHPDKQKLSMINMGVRIFNVLTIGNILRAIMFLSTSLPSPADHCMPDSETYNPPTNVLEIFTHFSSISGNCGDLIFSGHTLQDIILFWHVFRHSGDIFLSKKARVMMTTLMTLLVCAQLVFIIASRNHYTVDVVVGVYVSSTLWYIYNKKFPKDKKFVEDHSMTYNADGYVNMV